MSLMKHFLLIILISGPVLRVIAAASKHQQQVDPKLTPGYDASAAEIKSAETPKDDATPAVATATNAYEGEVAVDMDLTLSQEDLETMFKPIYSSTDKSTHAGASHGSQYQHTAYSSTGGKASLKPIKVEKSGPSRAVRQAQQSVSINDLMLGLDGSEAAQKHQDSAPNQYESNEAISEDTEEEEAAANTLQESGQPGGIAANKYTAGPGAPGAFTGGPSLVKQHQAWQFDNPETSNDLSDGKGTFVAAAGGSYSGLDHNLLTSLNNGLSFLLRTIGSSSRREKAQRRQLLQDGQDPNTASAAALNDDSPDNPNTYERELTETDEEVAMVLERAEYAASAFELPVAAVQAAKVQREELQRLLAANKVARVQFEQEQDDDVSPPQAPDTAAASAASAGTAAHNNPSRSHRKLFAMPDTAAHLLISKTGRGGKPLWGVTYSWRRAEACDGGRFVCRCPHPDDLEVDIDLLYKFSDRIRTYSAECPDLMRMLLHHTTANSHVNWLLGIWISKDTAANQAQIDLLGKLLTEFPIASLAGIVVGNEAISRRDVSQEQLIEAIAQVRGMVRAIAQKSNSLALAKVPVMTAELPATYTAELAAAVDVVGANIQPFYSGSIDTTDKRWVKTAVGSTMQQYTQLQDKFKGKQIVMTEVGWPTKSGEMDTNRASTEQAAAFAKAWVQAAEKSKVPYFYHELADAAWKTALRKGAAAAARAGPNKAAKRQPGLLSMGVLGDEHFGLVSANRQVDKGLLTGLAAQR